MLIREKTKKFRVFRRQLTKIEETKIGSGSIDVIHYKFRQGTESDETDSEVIAQMKEMIYRVAAFRPVSFADEAVVEKPRRRNVRISSDPQTENGGIKSQKTLLVSCKIVF
ncbi:hypothetical protein L1987_09668 [Smallanthus sonchifolius]|uniref:Uncharacterized protein n=1 Tax=Smallanthus sonchifolius TaxID=185202 RepID=A0ACB9JQ03_9ASTR|nr:hypothetical protein L1987_09668 [Smallanthus sonchifolius]